MKDQVKPQYLRILVILGLEKVRKYVFKAPSIISTLGPFVVVPGIASDVQHVINRTGSAHHLCTMSKM